MGQLGKTIAATGGFSVMYGEAMLKDVTPQMFARMPSLGGKTIVTNHPAFTYGHLAVYAARMFELMGLPVPAAAVKPAGWDELFKQGVECKDDPSGTIYPAMETITRAFLDGYKAVLAALPEVDDATLAEPNPAGGRFTAMLPTVGGAINFLVTGHPMSHLGQVSTWRRCMGLGPAM